MRISTIDGHVAGGAVRLVTGGLVPVTGDSMAARAAALTKTCGAALESLSREPRGHAGLVVAVLAEPDRPDADAGLLFVRDQGPVALSAHALVGATALALDAKLVEPRRTRIVTVETLAGAVDLQVADPAPPGAAARLGFCSPAVILRGNQPVTIGRRRVHADIVWSRAGIVAIVDAEGAGAPLVSQRALELGRVGTDVLGHLAAAVRVADPITGDRARIDAAVFIGAAPEGGVDVRSGSVDCDGTVERSPDVRASLAVAAVLSAMNLLPPGRRLVHQGLLGTSLEAAVVSIGELGGQPMVEVEVEADTWITGEHTFFFRRGDPLRDGVTWP